MDFLPLPPGSRPAFGSTKLLERLMLHHNADLPSWGVSVRTGLSAVALLRAYAYLLSQQPVLDVPTILRAWQDLPVIFSPQLAWEWEKAKPWQDLGIHTFYLNQYNDLLEGPSPSSAYCPTAPAGKDVNAHWEVFTAYLSQSPRQNVCAWLLGSAEIWQDWISRHPGLPAYHQEFSNLYSSLLGLGLDQDQAQVLVMLETFWQQLEQDFPASSDLLFMLSWEKPNAFLSACASGLSVPFNILFNLFSNPVLAQLYSPTWAGAGRDPEKENPSRPGLAALSDCRTRPWQDVLNNWRDSGKMPWRQAAPPESGLDHSSRWAFLDGQFQQSVASLSRSAKILVVGQPGAGKTQFCSDVLSQAELCALPLSTREDSPKNNFQQLALSLWETVMVPGSVLLIDGHETFFESPTCAQLLRTSPARVIVAMSSLSAVHPQVRASFDKIVFVDEMPVPARLDLARKHFPDQLALRVARSLKTPKAIVSAAQWCAKSSSMTWETVYQHHRATQRALEFSDVLRFEIEPAPILSQLAPLAGSPVLDELMSRLLVAIEKPEQFAAMGATPPKGAVLLGGPGLGKTLFARHLAARLSCPMIVPDPADLYENPQIISQLFETARANAPCVILMDEVDKLISLDQSVPPTSLSSLLTEIDGVHPLEGVLVVLTTNNPNIAPPLLRSGRLSELVHLQAPIQDHREQIWQAYLSRHSGPDLDVPKWATVLAQSSRGFTGADIAEVLRRNAVDMVMANKQHLSLSSLVSACDLVRWSFPNGRDPISLDQRRAIAIHEAGHALLAWRWKLDVLRITVRCRQNSMGSVQWDVPELDYDSSRTALFGKTQMVLGGIAAEQALLGSYGGGGSSDLKNSQRRLTYAFAYSGLGSLGPTSADHDTTAWSEAMRQRVEIEVQQFSRLAFDEATQWLSSNADLVNELADRLLELGDMSGPELSVYAQRVHTLANLPQVPSAELVYTTILPTSQSQGSTKVESGSPHTLHAQLNQSKSSAD